MNQKRLYKVFVYGFLFLYLLVATISFCHAIQFFNVGNSVGMSVTLAFAFELGLALSLAAVLLSDANKKSVLPWILMTILTAVQVIGNVYSTYKYMALSGEEYYRYLAKPLLFWAESVTEDNVQVVVSWIMGAILPIIALFMTDMVATNIKNMNSDAETPESAASPEFETGDETKNEEIARNGARTETENEKKEEPIQIRESVTDETKTNENDGISERVKKKLKSLLKK